MGARAGEPPAADVIGSLAELGARLRDAGLREPMATAAYGGATGIHATRLAPSRPPLAATPATAALELWVARRSVDVSLATRAIGDLDVALSEGILERTGDRLVARLQLVPFRDLLLACPAGQLPDDSSLHLLGALPGRCDGRWLDVGTGCGVAPLCRPRLGSERLGTDIDARLVALARLGAALSGLEGAARFAAGDLCEPASGRFHLISFNAPLPLPGPLLERFWKQAARQLAPGGEVVVHAATAEPPELRGEVVALRYTPAGAPVPFAVIRWRPDRPQRRRLEAVELTAASPHISRRDFDR